MPIAVGELIAELGDRRGEAVGGDVMSAHVLVGADGRVLVADVNGRLRSIASQHEAWARVGRVRQPSDAAAAA